MRYHGPGLLVFNTNKQVALPHSLLQGTVTILYHIIFNTNKQVALPHSLLQGTVTILYHIIFNTNKQVSSASLSITSK